MMVMNVLFVCVFLFEMLIASIFFSSIADKKRPISVILILGTLIFEVGAIINIFIISTSWLNVLVSFFATWALSVFFFKIKLIRASFYSLILNAFSAIIEHSVVFLISSFSTLYITEYKAETTLLVIEIVISKVLYFLFTMIISRFSQKDKTILKIPTAFYVFPLITLVAVICFWYICLNQYLEMNNQIILGVVSVLLLFATLFVFFSFQASAQREHKLLLLQQEQDKIKTDISYYDILEQQNNNLREYAHDAKKHLSAIKNINTNPELEVYISKMSERLSDYSKVCHSGNHTLDVLIDKYVTECKINDILFEFDIRNNNLSQIESYDLVTILGNLLDNAVEASKNSMPKTVSIETDFRNDFSVIIISNSCSKNPLSDELELPLTTKTNKQLHGFGLRSVKRTGKKYNGDIAFDCIDDRNFIVTVMLEKKE